MESWFIMKREEIEKEMEESKNAMFAQDCLIKILEEWISKAKSKKADTNLLNKLAANRKKMKNNRCRLFKNILHLKALKELEMMK